MFLKIYLVRRRLFFVPINQMSSSRCFNTSEFLLTKASTDVLSYIWFTKPNRWTQHLRIVQYVHPVIKNDYRILRQEWRYLFNLIIKMRKNPLPCSIQPLPKTCSSAVSQITYAEDAFMRHLEVHGIPIHDNGVYLIPYLNLRKSPR